MATQQYESVLQSELHKGDIIIVQGYEWVIDAIRYHAEWPTAKHGKGVYRIDCHWSGNGHNPKFFNDNMTLGQREDLTYWRKIG